jgi:dATP pyrophosphohydrolase
MRAPFQVLGIPYKFEGSELKFCVFRRSDIDQWQFVSGGGEDSESPIDAIKREIFEETSVKVNDIIPLSSMCYIPVEIFQKRHIQNWPDDTYVVPEYSFGFECNEGIQLSSEHCEFCWLSYEGALKVLRFDSNKTAMYELKRRIESKTII